MNHSTRTFGLTRHVPIETRYAGCRFRSRLEARWAVCFDTLGIRWEYEPEGLLVEDRLSLLPARGSWAYLPDFWLPDDQVWVEVKGALDDEGLRRVLSSAAYLSAPKGHNDGHDTLLLGPVPRVHEDGRGRHSGMFPPLLHLHDGELLMSAWKFMSPCDGVEYASESGGLTASPENALNGWGPVSSLGSGWERELIDGYTAARSARFEHEEGAR